MCGPDYFSHHIVVVGNLRKSALSNRIRGQARLRAPTPSASHLNFNVGGGAVVQRCSSNGSVTSSVSKGKGTGYTQTMQLRGPDASFPEPTHPACFLRALRGGGLFSLVGRNLSGVLLTRPALPTRHARADPSRARGCFSWRILALLSLTRRYEGCIIRQRGNF